MTQITGYRVLTDEEIALINEIKAKANEVGELVKRIYKSDATDPRWASIAKTDLQQGFMALTRAVAKPEGF